VQDGVTPGLRRLLDRKEGAPSRWHIENILQHNPDNLTSDNTVHGDLTNTLNGLGSATEHDRISWESLADG
jgi:hypothetical protein